MRKETRLAIHKNSYFCLKNQPDFEYRAFYRPADVDRYKIDLLPAYRRDRYHQHCPEPLGDVPLDRYPEWISERDPR